MKSITSLWASTPVFFCTEMDTPYAFQSALSVASGPVTMCQFASVPSEVVPSTGASSDWASAFGSVLTVTNSTSVASAPRSTSACSISAASTGQMSLQGALKNVRTTTCGGRDGTEVGFSF